MKAIVTRQNEDGTFNEVGMNTRYISDEYKLLRNLLTFGVSARKGIYRLEIYHGNSIFGAPQRVIYVKRDNFGAIYQVNNEQVFS